MSKRCNTAARVLAWCTPVRHVPPRSPGQGGIKLGAAAARRAASPFRISRANTSRLRAEALPKARPAKGGCPAWRRAVGFPVASMIIGSGRIWPCRGMRTKVFFHSERERGRRGVAGRQQPRRYATVDRSSLACREHALAWAKFYGSWGGLSAEERQDLLWAGRARSVLAAAHRAAGAVG